MSDSQAAEPEDEVTTAVQLAKAYVRKLWKDENIRNLGLEEVTHEGGNTWRITIGFTRPWDQPVSPGALSYMFPPPPPIARTYKTVLVDTETKEVTQVLNREINRQ